MNKKPFSLLLVGLLAIPFVLSSCDKHYSVIYNDDGQIQTQISSEEMEDEDYNAAVRKLKECGFKNIKINFLNDVILGLFVKEDGVDSIRINGVSSYTKDDFFDEKCLVCLDVHSRHGGVEFINEPIDGQLPIMYTEKDFKGIDKLLLGNQIKDVGFTNVTYNPIQDCVNEYDWDLNTTSSLSIHGNTVFNEYDFFDIDELITISYHTVPGDYCTNGLEHTIVQTNGVAPTCTEPGWTSGSYCSVCNKSFDGRVEIPATGHTKVVDVEATEATCVSEGHTEGAHCETCGVILSVSETIPIDPDNHLHLDITEAIEATCISEGRTEGVTCLDCHEVLSVSEILPIDPDNHKHTTVIAGTPATCMSKGISDGQYCNDCEKVVVAQHETDKDPNNHTNIIIDPAVPATEGTNGKSQGKHCGDCGAVIVPQTTTYWYPSLSWMMSNNPTSAQVTKFVNAYKNQTISFNGWIYHSEYYSSYTTIFNIYISGGDYVNSSTHNAIFKFEAVSQANGAIRDILGKGKGTLVRVNNCKVKSASGTYVILELGTITTR